MTKPKLRKLAPKIYCLEFDNAYDLSMTFLRCQEFYESPKFRDTYFTLSDFMEWYSKNYGDGAFTYPVDFVGFNLPSRVIMNVMAKLKVEKYDVWTPYDQLMFDTWGKIVKDMPDQNRYECSFYLIGVMEPKKDKHTLYHELAHALFTTDPDYQKKMGALVNALPEKVWKSMTKKLKARGYADNVYDDEAQAYFASQLHPIMLTKALRKAARPFKAVLKPYLDKIL